jgi:hypothetical protein
MISTSARGSASFASTQARAGQVLRVGPRGPYFVHRRAVADVGDPDRRGEDLRLVRSGLRQQPVDLVEDFLGLTLDVRLELFRHDASEVDGVLRARLRAKEYLKNHVVARSFYLSP